MKPEKAIQNLKNKLKRDRLFVSDYDRESINSIIKFYNETETGMMLSYNNYRKLVLLLFLYELKNSKILRNEKPKMNAKEVQEKIEQLIVYKDEDLLSIDLVNEVDVRRLFNFEAENETPKDDDNLDEYLEASQSISAKAKEKLFDMVNQTTTSIIANESYKNKQ